MVPGQREFEVLAGDGPAVAGLEPELHEGGEHAAHGDADGLAQADGHEQGARPDQGGGGGGPLVEGRDDRVVGEVPQHGGGADGDGGVQHGADDGDAEDPRLGAGGDPQLERGREDRTGEVVGEHLQHRAGPSLAPAQPLRRRGDLGAAPRLVGDELDDLVADQSGVGVENDQEARSHMPRVAARAPREKTPPRCGSRGARVGRLEA